MKTIRTVLLLSLALCACSDPDVREIGHPVHPFPFPGSTPPSFNEEIFTTTLSLLTDSKADGQERSADVRVTVNEKGEVVDAAIIQGNNSLFNTAVIDAIKSTRISPARYRGKAIAMMHIIPIRYRIPRPKRGAPSDVRMGNLVTCSGMESMDSVGLPD